MDLWVRKVNVPRLKSLGKAAIFITMSIFLLTMCREYEVKNKLLSILSFILGICCLFFWVPSVITYTGVERFKKRKKHYKTEQPGTVVYLDEYKEKHGKKYGAK